MYEVPIQKPQQTSLAKEMPFGHYRTHQVMTNNYSSQRQPSYSMALGSSAEAKHTNHMMNNSSLVQVTETSQFSDRQNHHKMFNSVANAADVLSSRNNTILASHRSAQEQASSKQMSPPQIYNQTSATMQPQQQFFNRAIVNNSHGVKQTNQQRRPESLIDKFNKR